VEIDHDDKDTTSMVRCPAAAALRLLRLAVLGTTAAGAAPRPA
jgi:hypothetical protein